MRDGSRTLGYGIVTKCNKDMNLTEWDAERKKVKKQKKIEQQQQELGM